jgi:hypothetical protein
MSRQCPGNDFGSPLEPASRRAHVRSRKHRRVTPVVAYIVSGVIGGTVGLLLALDALRRDRSGDGLVNAFNGWIPPVATVFAILAGVLVAWFLTSIIISWAPGKLRCPRCGSANRRTADSCTACQLPFA